MNSIAIIPARYASSRFPGKPLADMGGKPMIQRVYEQAKKAFSNVIVATDDERISGAVMNFGGMVVMTSAAHKSGTDRCAEALQLAENILSSVFDIIVNVQGDEPFVQPAQLELLASCFTHSETQIATLARPAHNVQELSDPNKPKVILNKNSEAIYFSRSVIPYVRGIDLMKWTDLHNFYMHIGLYAFRKDVLKKITKLEPTLLEKAESLEQLRWIENGYRIQVKLTNYESHGIDTPDDLKKAMQMLGNQIS
ncbi:MAG: 3-deoxy-manno-octulosonate cytidylyltransferase [Bacteroidales bacterium]|nr:3-deoxy-manno-octulosonate cytidylyltransferase [Bacteroidales bacterium]